MIHILARIVAQPQHAAAMREALADLVAASRKESGCLSYDLYQRADDPAVFQTVEAWRDGAAADAHMTTPHVSAAIAEAGAWFAAAPEIVRYEKIA